MPKRFAFDHEAREALRRGVDQLVDTVKVTLGPCGRSVALDPASGSPTITNDGATIAREIVLPDPFENLGAELAREVTNKTQQTAGDGTTTAAVLMQEMVRRGLPAVASGWNPMGLKRGMDRALVELLAELERMATPIGTDDEIIEVARIAARGEETLAATVARALAHTGAEGLITVIEGRGVTTELELVDGLRFAGGYLSPYFVTDAERMEAVLLQPRILVVDGTVDELEPLLPLLEQVSREGRDLLLVAGKIEAEQLATLVVNRLRGTLRVVAVPAPDRAEARRARLEDLAAITGARLLAADLGRSLDSVTAADLGTAGRVVVDAGETTVLDGGGDREAISARADTVRRRLEGLEPGAERDRLRERLGYLQGGVGIIRIGAPTETALHEARGRAEDALATTLAAISGGVVPGGGVGLLRAGRVLAAEADGDAESQGRRILYRSLAAPIAQIAENAGAPGKVVAAEVDDLEGAVGYNALTGKMEDLNRAGVVDALLVLRSALQNAVSIAGLVLTTETLITEVGEDQDPEAG